MDDDKAVRRPLFGPVAVGALLLLYGLGMFLMSEGEASPALLLLVATLRATCIWWGFRAGAGRAER